MEPTVNGLLLLAGAAAALLLVSAPVAFLYALRRQTARKAAALESAEERNRAFIAALPDLFFITDYAGRYLEFITSNPSILHRPAEERVGLLMEDTGLDPHIVAMYRRVIEAIAAGSPLEVMEYDLAVYAGLRHFDSRVVPLGSDRVLFIVRDLTEKHRAEQALAASLREKEILLKEIHHRVKNNMQVISSLIQLQASTLREDHERALLHETQQRIRSMAQVHELLYQSSSLSSVDAAEYIRRLFGELMSAYSAVAGSFDAVLDLEPLVLHVDAAIPLGLIVNELVSNALKYAFSPGRNGRLGIILKRLEGGRTFLSVQDDGPGLPEDWEERAGVSLGLTLVRSLSMQLKGSIRFMRDGGTRAELIF